MDEKNGTPATKHDIERVLEVANRIEACQKGLETRLTTLETNLQTVEADLRAEFAQRIEAVEAKLLGAFFNYQHYGRVEK
jgi:hypothetical protein